MKSFSNIHWSDYTKQYYEKVRNEILSSGKEYILNADDEEYISYLVNKYTLEPLKILTDTEHVKIESKSQEMKKDIYIDDKYLADVFKFRITYNFEGTSELFQVIPDPYTWSCYDIEIIDFIVFFIVSINYQDKDEFQREKDSCYNRAFANLPNLNKNVLKFKDDFEKNIRNLFFQEKDKFKKENDFYTAINVKVNPNTASIFTPPTIIKKKIPQPIVSMEKEINSVPSMSQRMYQDILKVIYDFGKSMEKKPTLYMNKDEQGIRDLFIILLETRYEGTTVTGETFNKKGKTDILLKYADDASNLFVAECKIWHGASQFHEAIYQLFERYLTWRDSKVALILFIQNQDFTKTLETILIEAPKNKYYKKFVEKRGDSSFSYIFQLPQDRDQTVHLEVIAFHFDKVS